MATPSEISHATTGEKLSHSAAVEVGLSILEKYNWVRVQKTSGAGRPSEFVSLHPNLLNKAKT